MPACLLRIFGELFIITFAAAAAALLDSILNDRWKVKKAIKWKKKEKVNEEENVAKRQRLRFITSAAEDLKGETLKKKRKKKPVTQKAIANFANTHLY